MIIVVAGVTGSGKTTIGRRVAQALDLSFIDADDFHAPESIDKMRAGVALTDDDRAPWLDRLNAELRRSGDGVVLACSALSERSRHRLTVGLDQADVRLVFLRADLPTLQDRLDHRRGHFAGASLLPSQLEALDEPENAMIVDAGAPIDVVADRVVAALRAARERAGDVAHGDPRRAAPGSKYGLASTGQPRLRSIPDPPGDRNVSDISAIPPTPSSTASSTTVSPTTVSPSSSLQPAGQSDLMTDSGTTSIADSVVAKIAGVAAKEISGVHSMGAGTSRAIGAIKSKVGRTSVSQGVSVEVGQRQAAVDLDVIADYGVSIVDLSQAIRDNVIGKVQDMTGLEVTEVNISVNDVWLGDTEPEEPRVQ